MCSNKSVITCFSLKSPVEESEYKALHNQHINRNLVMRYIYDCMISVFVLQTRIKEVKYYELRFLKKYRRIAIGSSA